MKTQNVRSSDLETTLKNNLIKKIQNEQDNEDTAAVKSNNKSSVNSQINMKETPGETKVNSASDEQKSPSTSDSKAPSTEAAKCTKETSRVLAASQNNSPVQEHTEATGRGDLLQIYIGKFAPNTTKEHIKDHLVKSSVGGVTDVKCLTSDNSDKSFCVTLNSSGAQKLIFGTNIWPKGVATRPFKPAPKQKATKLFKLRAANYDTRGQSQSKKSGEMKQRNLRNQRKPDYHQQYQYGSPWHHHDGRDS